MTIVNNKNLLKKTDDTSRSNTRCSPETWHDLLVCKGEHLFVHLLPRFESARVLRGIRRVRLDDPLPADDRIDGGFEIGELAAATRAEMAPPREVVSLFTGILTAQFVTSATTWGHSVPFAAPPMKTSPLALVPVSVDRISR